MSYNGLGYKRRISNDKSKAPVTSCRHGLAPLFSLIYSLFVDPYFSVGSSGSSTYPWGHPAWFQLYWVWPGDFRRVTNLLRGRGKVLEETRKISVFLPCLPPPLKPRHHPTLGTFETKMIARNGLVTLSARSQRCYGRIKDSERLEVRVICREGKCAHLYKINRWKK